MEASPPSEFVEEAVEQGVALLVAGERSLDHVGTVGAQIESMIDVAEPQMLRPAHDVNHLPYCVDTSK